MRFLHRLAPYRVQLTTIGTIILIALAVVTAWPRDLFFSNQSDKFQRGLYLAGRDFLQNDWTAQTRPSHPAFVALVSALDRLGILDVGVDILEIVLYLSLLFAFWLLIGKLYDALTANGTLVPIGIQRSEFVLVILGIYVILQNVPDLLASFYRMLGQFGIEYVPWIWSRTWEIEGLASQGIFARYLQPSEFAILILLAIALMLYSKWRIAALLIAIATNIHFGFLVHGSILLITAAAWLYRQGSRRNAFEIILIFGVANLPAFIGGPLAFAMEPGSIETRHLMANVRIPHHSLPWVWWNDFQALKVGFMLLASCLLIWKVPGVLRWIVSIGTGVICLGILTVLITRNDSLELMHPWRSSVYLYPISQVIILGFAMTYGVRFLFRFYQRIWGVTLTAFYTFLILTALVQVRTLIISSTLPPPSPDQFEAIANLTQQHTTIHNVILIPANLDSFWDFENFKLDAQRPVFVEAKAPPYFPSEFLEWWRRVGVTEEFYTASHPVRREICYREGVDYYILPANEHVPREDFVATTDTYQLVRCF